MEKRRLFKLGKSSLVISLPKNWLTKHNLKGGDEVLIEEKEDGSLEIRPATVFKFKASPLMISCGKKFHRGLLERLILSAYITGRDPIIIEIDKEILEPVTDEINKVVKKAKELEIIRETSKKDKGRKLLIISSILKEDYYPIKSSVDRMVSLIQTMVRYLALALEKGSSDYLVEINYMEAEVDRVYLKLLKQLFWALRNSIIAKEMGISNFSDVLLIRTLVQLMEITADLIAEISEFTLKVGIKKLIGKNEIKNAISSLTEYHKAMEDLFFNTFTSIDVVTINRILDDLEKLREKCFLTSIRISDKDILVWFKEFSLRFSSMVDFLKVIAELILDQMIEKLGKKISIGEKREK